VAFIGESSSEVKGYITWRLACSPDNQNPVIHQEGRCVVPARNSHRTGRDPPIALCEIQFSNGCFLIENSSSGNQNIPIRQKGRCVMHMSSTQSECSPGPGASARVIDFCCVACVSTHPDRCRGCRTPFSPGNQDGPIGQEGRCVAGPGNIQAARRAPGASAGIIDF